MPNLSSVRIIGGEFRHRKIQFNPTHADLRPTHDRIRETVFQWLSSYLENSVCLDAFAGSGVMGFEALSRGAKEVVFCDKNPTVIADIKKNAEQLKINNALFICGDVSHDHRIPKKNYDIVFLDPPFEKNLLLSTCQQLENQQLLNKNAHIYLECKKGSVDFSLLPTRWVIKKHKSTKTIDVVLCHVS